MIENIEEFCTKFQCGPFPDSSVLVKCKIPIVDSRSMEEAALCVSDAAQGFRREGRGIEEQMLRISRVKEVNRLAVVIGHVGRSGKRQIVAIADDKIVRYIEGGKRPA